MANPEIDDLLELDARATAANHSRLGSSAHLRPPFLVPYALLILVTWSTAANPTFALLGGTTDTRPRTRRAAQVARVTLLPIATDPCRLLSCAHRGASDLAV